MKKIVSFILALAVVFCGVAAVSISASAKISPTAPTITRPTGGSDPATVPSSPHVTETSTTRPGGGTEPGTTPGGKPTVPSQTATTPGQTTPGQTTPGQSATVVPTDSHGNPIYTTPDGSTITGPARPDDNPNAPETGDTSMEVFAFAGVAVACTAAAILLKKNKEDDQ